VDQDKRRVALGLKQLEEDPWERRIPETYVAGEIVRGKVTKVTNFGVFVELEPGLEGLLHVSELADHKVENPEDIVKPGEEIEVKVLRVDADDRKIGLSLKRVQWVAEEDVQEAEGERETPRLGGIQHAEEDADQGEEGEGKALFDTPLLASKSAEAEEPAEEGPPGEAESTEAEAEQDAGKAPEADESHDTPPETEPEDDAATS